MIKLLQLVNSLIWSIPLFIFYVFVALVITIILFLSTFVTKRKRYCGDV